MTVDKKCFDLAAAWLAGSGWTHSGDAMKLAELIQDVCDDFTADLENEYEDACEHGKTH